MSQIGNSSVMEQTCVEKEKRGESLRDVLLRHLQSDELAVIELERKYVIELEKARSNKNNTFCSIEVPKVQSDENIFCKKLKQ